MRKVFNKRCEWALAGIASIVVLLAAPSAAFADPVNATYPQILDFERLRSSGNGVLAKYLESPDSALAARAALALGRTRKNEARAPLAGCLAKSSEAVRAMCAYGLGLLGTPSDIATLTPFVNDSGSAVRYAVADALGRIVAATPASGTTAAADIVLRMAQRDPDPQVRGHAAISLSHFAKSPAAGALPAKLAAAFASEPDPGVRERLMWCAARSFAVETPASMLLAGLKDTNELVRVSAVRALGKRKTDSTARGLLHSMARDPSWRVLYEVRESLATLSGKARTEHLTSIPPGIPVPALPPHDPQSAIAAETTPQKLSPPALSDVATLPLAITGSSSMLGEPYVRDGRPRVRIETTKGSFTLVLFSDWAPYTVANFLSLATKGYFNGDRWFRIVPDFVVQTGDRSNTGDGDAGYSIPAEENPIEQTSGIISMGLNYDGSKPQRDSAGTQFYLTLSPQYHLDRDFTVFGRVVDGFDVLPNLIESDRIVHVVVER